MRPRSTGAPTSTSSTSSSTAAPPSDGRGCRPSAPPSPIARSPSWSATCAGSPVNADSGELFDSDQDELSVALAHRELHTVTRLGVDRVEEGRIGGDRHQLDGV